MKLSNGYRLFIAVICTFEQIIYLATAVYLIDCRGWNPWWMMFAFLLVVGASPSYVIAAIEKESKNQNE